MECQKGLNMYGTGIWTCILVSGICGQRCRNNAHLGDNVFGFDDTSVMIFNLTSIIEKEVMLYSQILCLQSEDFK